MPDAVLGLCYTQSMSNTVIQAPKETESTAKPLTKYKVPQTPMMAQFMAMKAEYPDAILFFRLGDFYEMFGEDAIVSAKVLQIALTSRDKKKQRFSSNVRSTLSCLRTVLEQTYSRRVQGRHLRTDGRSG